MKKHIYVLALISLITTLYVYADDAKQEQSTPATEGACSKVREACEISEFMKQIVDGKKRSLYKDCMQPILNGDKVEGVTVDAVDIKSCNLKKAELKNKK